MGTKVRSGVKKNESFRLTFNLIYCIKNYIYFFIILLHIKNIFKTYPQRPKTIIFIG
jgi:hypothetical protein